jgi:hypothetical protein
MRRMFTIESIEVTELEEIKGRVVCLEVREVYKPQILTWD